MKRLILAMIGLGILIGLAFSMNRQKAEPVSPAEAVAESPPQQTMEDQPFARRHTPGPERSPQAAVAAAKAGSSSPEAATSPTTGAAASIALSQAVDILVSRQASLAQKQAAWKQLKEGGKLDQAISDLEQRALNDPHAAEYPAALGQAYLQKCSMIQDVREQGILAMQADKVFETALNLDPANWEARFTKAVAMSYWPANLNKGQEVIDNFQTLVEQQETQAPQPQFAETYLWLGDQYQKAGRSDEARSVWQRGAALFPDNDGLKTRLTP